MLAAEYPAPLVHPPVAVILCVFAAPVPMAVPFGANAFRVTEHHATAPPSDVSASKPMQEVSHAEPVLEKPSVET